MGERTDLNGRNKQKEEKGGNSLGSGGVSLPLRAGVKEDWEFLFSWNENTLKIFFLIIKVV